LNYKENPEVFPHYNF